MASNESVTLLKAVGLYVDNLKSKDGQSQAKQQLRKFVQWCGGDKAVSDLTPPEIEEYGEQAAGTDGGAQSAERLKEVRKFLSFAKRKGLIQQNMAQHLRIRKSKIRRDTAGDSSDIIELTPDGHAQLVKELEELKARRSPLAAEIREAAADKDVRENVPLEAAREQLGHVESRIREIENTLKSAIIVDPSKRKGKVVRVGMKVMLKDLGTGRQTRYTLVSAYEAKPLEGKISDVSPVGKALLRRSAGQEVDVETPRGKLRYRIVRVSY